MWADETQTMAEKVLTDTFGKAIRLGAGTNLGDVNMSSGLKCWMVRPPHRRVWSSKAGSYVARRIRSGVDRPVEPGVESAQ